MVGENVYIYLPQVAKNAFKLSTMVGEKGGRSKISFFWGRGGRIFWEHIFRVHTAPGKLPVCSILKHKVSAMSV